MQTTQPTRKRDIAKLLVVFALYCLVGTIETAHAQEDEIGIKFDFDEVTEYVNDDPLPRSLMVRYELWCNGEKVSNIPKNRFTFTMESVEPGTYNCVVFSVAAARTDGSGERRSEPSNLVVVVVPGKLSTAKPPEGLSGSLIR